MIELGDVIDVLKKYDDDTFSGCFCDPPYGLSFMGKSWDGEVPDVNVWSEVYRTMKSGSYVLAFGGTRTFHRLACAIEDAGFEIRDTIMWVYGTGFPKSHSIGKAVDALKKTGKSSPKALREVRMGDNYEPTGQKDYRKGRMFGAEVQNDTVNTHIVNNEWEGYGTALKPAYEPIIMAMKPLDGTYAHNAIEHGVGGINIDTSRVGDGGRWPANLIHDGSAEVTKNFPDRKTTYVTKGHRNNRSTESAVGDLGHPGDQGYDDEGSASRFFYVPKPSAKERNEGRKNTHPTVKPIVLCEYLAKMILPPNEHKLLVPFSGSGSEMIGAMNAGWKGVTGIEISEEFVEIAKTRIEYYYGCKGLEKFFCIEKEK